MLSACVGVNFGDSVGCLPGLKIVTPSPRSIRLDVVARLGVQCVVPSECPSSVSSELSKTFGLRASATFRFSCWDSVC